MTGTEAKNLFRALADTFETQKGRLGELDAAVGDGDHGVGMARGFARARDAAESADDTDVGQVFTSAGRAFMAGAGGASGPIFGLLLIELGKPVVGKDALSLDLLKLGVGNAVAAVTRIGKVEPRDKTMLDALLPASEALQRAGTLEDGLARAAAAAARGVEKTAEMEAKKGRARYVEGKGVGHVDPGAASLALFFETLCANYRASS